MEDELDQEGMEEEVTPSKGAGKGSPVKMIIIIVVMLVIAVVLVFGVIKPMFFAADATEEENTQQEEISPQESTDYWPEYLLDPSVTVSHTDKNGKVRNIIVDVTFVGPDAALSELQKRGGQIRDLVSRTVKAFEFEKIMGAEKIAYQDSITKIIKYELNIRLKSDEKIQYLFLQFVTM